MALSLEQIKANAAPAKFVEVEVPQWGGKARLSKLGAAPALALGKKYAAAKKDDKGEMTDPEEMVDFFALLVGNCLVDDSGARILLDTDGQDFLRRQPLEVLSKLADEAMTLNGMKSDEAVKELEKKTSPARIGSSPSPSPTI